MDILNLVCVLLISCAVKGLTGFEDEQFWNKDFGDGNAYYSQGNNVRYRTQRRTPQYGFQNAYGPYMKHFEKQNRNHNGRYQTHKSATHPNSVYQPITYQQTYDTRNTHVLQPSKARQQPTTWGNNDRYVAYDDYSSFGKSKEPDTRTSAVHSIPQRSKSNMHSNKPSQWNKRQRKYDSYELRNENLNLRSDNLDLINYNLDLRNNNFDLRSGNYDVKRASFDANNAVFDRGENTGYSGSTINWHDMLKVIDKIFHHELEDSLHNKDSIEFELAQRKQKHYSGNYENRNDIITSWFPHTKPTPSSFSTYPTDYHPQHTMRISAKTLTQQSNQSKNKPIPELTPEKMKKKPDVLITVTHPEHGTHQWWYRQTTPVDNRTKTPHRATSETNRYNPDNSNTYNPHQNPYSIQEDKKTQNKQNPESQDGHGTGFYNEDVEESKKSFIKWEEFVWKLWKPMFFQRLLDLARSTVHIYFFPTDVNKNGEIDVVEDMDDTGPMYYHRPRADVFKPINQKLYSAIDKHELIQKRNKPKLTASNKAVRMDDDTGHRVRRDASRSTLTPAIEDQIVSSPVFQNTLNDLLETLHLGIFSSDGNLDDRIANYLQHGDLSNNIYTSQVVNGRHSVSVEEPLENTVEPDMSPKDRHDMIQTLWPDSRDTSQKLGVSAKEGPPVGSDPYNQQQQHMPMNQYSDVLNNAYGFNQMTSDAAAFPLLATLLSGNYNDKNDAASYQSEPARRPKSSSTVNQLWPGATYTDTNDKSAYPYVPVKSYSNPSTPQGSYSSDPHGIIDTVQPKPHNPIPHQNKPRRRASPGYDDSLTAKEGYSSGGYGGQSSKGYGSSHGSSGYGQSSGGYGHSSGGYGGGQSSGYGGGHSSGYGGGHSSGYGGMSGHSSGGYGGSSSGYGHSSGGYGHGGGGGYGKTKKWEGGEKSYGSGKKGTKGTDGRESHIYSQGKWHEKNKDNRKTKGNKVKTYSYGGHGWYKEETHGEESGNGNKDAYSNHEDWKQEKGKHEAQEYPHHEYNTKTHGYHKDLGYHK